MKNRKEYVPSEMGKEINEMENKYHEYFELKRKFEWLYHCFEKVVIIVVAMCAMDIFSTIIDCLQCKGGCQK